MRGYLALTFFAVALVLLVQPLPSLAEDVPSRCYRGNQDIVFLIDSSGSIDKNNWVVLKQFVVDLISALDVGENKTRIAATVFSDNVCHAFHLDTFNSTQGIVDAVANLNYTGGGTATDLGIRDVRQEQLTEMHGARSKAPDVIVLVTDGASYNLEATEVQVNLTMAALIQMFAVGIGNLNEENLAVQGYSGFWTTTDFTALQDIIANLTSIRCLREVNKTRECVVSCKEAQEDCYREGSIQICRCYYDWVSKYCYPPSFPNATPGQGGGDGGGGTGVDVGGGTFTKDGACYLVNPSAPAGPTAPYPRIDTVCPTYGPEAGGTDLFIWGDRFMPSDGQGTADIEDSLNVTVGGSECKVLLSNATFIHCITSSCAASHVPNDVAVLVRDWRTTERGVFTCKPNPAIVDLYPMQLFVAGGTDLIVEGNNLQSVARPILEITMVYYTENGTTNTLFTSLCDPNSSTMMTCAYPPITLPDEFKDDARMKRSADVVGRPRHRRGRRDRNGKLQVVGGSGESVRRKRQSPEDPGLDSNRLQLYLGFKFDGLAAYTNISKAFPGKGVLYIYKNPDIVHFEEEDGIKDFEKTLLIKGENLDFGCAPSCSSYYAINVGTKPCAILDVAMTEIRCMPPPDEPDSVFKFKDAVRVTVDVGNLNFRPGHLLYPAVKTQPQPTTGDQPQPTTGDQPQPTTRDQPLYSWQVITIYISCAMIVLIVVLVCIYTCCYESYRSVEWRYHLKLAGENSGPTGRINPHVPYRQQIDTSVAEKIAPLVKEDKDVTRATLITKGKMGAIYSAWLFEARDIVIHVTAKALLDTRPLIPTLTRFLDDCLVLQAVSHKNLLPVYGVVFKHSRLHVLTGRAEYGTLKDFITTRKVGRSLKLKMCLDVAQGMEYLVDNNIVHKDLAARNCVVDEQYDVLIADRGLSADVNRADYFFLGSGRPPLPVRWAAVDVLNHGTYSAMSDVWSFGVLVWEVFSKGKVPYGNISRYRVRQHLNFGNRLERPVKSSLECYTTMKACWNPNPPNRPPFSKITIILNGMYLESNLSKPHRPAPEHSPVYIKHAHTGAVRNWNYKPPPVEEAAEPVDGVGHYDHRGTYLIEVDSDFDSTEDGQSVQPNEQQSVQEEEEHDEPLYAVVNKQPRARVPFKDHGSYVDVQPAPTPGSSQNSVRKPDYTNVNPAFVY